MARGWESKSVEEQISERQENAGKPAKVQLTLAERERLARRDGLLLLRSHTLSRIQATQNESFRKQQELALAFLDAELAALEK
jgi:hypothetical protein